VRLALSSAPEGDGGDTPGESPDSESSYDLRCVEELISKATDGDLGSRMDAVKSLGPIGGYSAVTCLLEMLSTEEPELRGVVIEALVYNYADPRVQPSLFSHLMRRNPFSGTYDDESAYILTCLSAYAPLAEPVQAYLTEHALKKPWWDDPFHSRMVPRALGALSGRDGKGTALWNEIFAATPVEAVNSDLLLSSTAVGDCRTVELLAELLEIPDRKIGDPLYPSMLHDTTIVMLEALLLWVHGKSSSDFLEQCPSGTDIEKLYLDKWRQLPPRQQMVREEFMLRDRLFRAILMRNVALARGLADEELKSILCGPDVGWWDVVFALRTAATGSWNAVEVLVRGCETGDKYARTSAQRFLVKVTGVNFGDDAAMWRWWLETARNQLQWDEYHASWGPEEKWEEIARAGEHMMRRKDD
jgi:hypothetical protein